MPRKPKFDNLRVCVKCRTSEGNIVIRHAVYCKECFTPLITTKFRRALEPHINYLPDGPRRSALKPSGDLLVGFSGGLGSTVLLDLVHRIYIAKRRTENGSGGKAHPKTTRVWKNVRVCYVEICDAFPGMRDRTAEIEAAVGRYEGFEFIPLRIQDAFDPCWWETASGGSSKSPPPWAVDLSNEELFVSPSPSESTPLASLHAYLQSLPTPTAIPATISTFTRLLLLYTARANASSHLLLGTSLTSLSISLISSIAQGGGFVIPQEEQEEWVPFSEEHSNNSASNGQWKGEVRILRPLREIGMKECAAWAWWNDLNVIGKESFASSRQTIAGLTKDFIVGLEKDYPSTVSTIARTCGKLAPKDDAGSLCVLCERPAQKMVHEWKSRISIRSSSDQKSIQTDSPASLTSRLCYSCHTTLTSRSSRSAIPLKRCEASGPALPVHLPLWVNSHLVTEPSSLDVGMTVVPEHTAQENELWDRQRMDNEAMRAVIGGFLLEE